MRKAANKAAIPRPFRPSGRGAGQDRGRHPPCKREGRCPPVTPPAARPASGCGRRSRRPPARKPVRATGCTGQSSRRGRCSRPNVCHSTMSVSSIDRPCSIQARDGLRAVALVDEAPGRIALAGVVGRAPEMVEDERGAFGHRRFGMEPRPQHAGGVQPVGRRPAERVVCRGAFHLPETFGIGVAGPARFRLQHRPLGPEGVAVRVALAHRRLPPHSSRPAGWRRRPPPCRAGRRTGAGGWARSRPA